jgi:hypothetical protein
MRLLLRVLAPLLGLALAAAGVILAIEVIAAWTRIDRDERGVIAPWPEWRVALEQLHWSDQPVPWVGVGVAVVGFVVMLVGLRARRVAIPLDGPQSWMTVTTSPRVLARLVGQRVRKGDDVAGATVTASRRRIAVAAQGWGDLDGETGKALRASVKDDVDVLLATVPLRRRPRVVVNLSQQRGVR